jgi:hypothetical protein
MISVKYGLKDQQSDLNGFLNWLIKRKAYNALFKYALERANLFVAIAIFKALKEIEYMPTSNLTMWESIQELLPGVSEKPNRRLLFNDAMLEGNNKIFHSSWVSEDGERLAYITLIYSSVDSNTIMPHLKIITSEPYRVQTIPLVYNGKLLGMQTKILGMDRDNAFFLDKGINNWVVYKCSLANNDLLEYMSINPQNNCYFYDNENHLLYYFDCKEKVIKTLDLLNNSHTQTSLDISDIIAANLKGITPLKAVGGYFLTTKEYCDGNEGKDKTAKIIVLCSNFLIVQPIGNALACDTNGNYLLRADDSIRGRLSLDVMCRQGELKEIVIDWTISKTEPKVEIKSKMGRPKKNSFVGAYGMGHRYKIIAVYYTKHDIRFYSAIDYKYLFSLTIEKSIATLDFVYNDQFLMLRAITRKGFGDVINLCSIGYLVTCSKPPNMLDIEDMIRIKPLLDETMYPNDKQLKVIAALARYFTIEKSRDESRDEAQLELPF